MDIIVDTLVPFPREMVYATYRDRLLEIQSYLPNVISLHLQHRSETSEQTHCLYEWQGGGDIPAVVRGFLGDALLTWTEENDWHHLLWQVRWQITPHLFPEAIDCAGKNAFLAQANQTLVQTRGYIRIDPYKLGGVPTPLRGMVAQVAEKVLSEAIAPNLSKMGEAITHLLSQGPQSTSPSAIPIRQ